MTRYHVTLEWSDGLSRDPMLDHVATSWRAACIHARQAADRVLREVSAPIAGAPIGALESCAGFEKEYHEARRLQDFFGGDRLPRALAFGRSVDRIGDYTLTIDRKG